ncbi:MULTISPECIES: hypothetical protein [unclassified Empedobacter]|uniref:hypothetical protein n=1 Tax=unclassified Empedobacter TaxID=2643773 RepID=UPI0025B9C122|nr:MULTISPECIES: hypothetical protein [unclassified Empedobacter]
MKNKYVYAGYIKIEYDKMKAIMKSIYGNKIRDRFASDIQPEINYEDSNTFIYISESDENAFLFSAEFLGKFDGAQNFINTIVQSLKKHGILYYQFEWNEIDDEGNQIGEEYEINS